MQHEALTPLGRQLRAALRKIQILSRQYDSHRSPHVAAHSRLRGQRHASRQFTSAVLRPLQTANGPTLSLENCAASSFKPEPVLPHEPANRALLDPASLTILSPNDHLTDALHDSDLKHRAAPRYSVSQRPQSKLHLSLVDPKSRRMWKTYKANRDKFLLGPRDLPSPSLQEITARVIRLRAIGTDSIELSKPTQRFLRKSGYGIDHVRAWADIISAKDALASAVTLEELLSSKGPAAVPAWVLLYTLRREFSSAQALKILMQCASTVFDHLSNNWASKGDQVQNVFLAVIRLIRHARKFMPGTIEVPVDMMLRHLQFFRQRNGCLENHHRSLHTYLLNKLMQLVSMPTTQHPFKDAVYQEAALIRIMKYMAEQKPPIQLDRQGYRAVVRVQLIQRKTAGERQWAELKSLAWPPWKVDRTAMDIAIGLEHGTTRAGATLDRMCEAGYSPLKWEQVARVYTGWDTDNTPTIQTRVALGLPGLRSAERREKSREPWFARIQATRTIQEAWACYLAWEEQSLPPNQQVYLAILTKLHAEEERQLIERKGVARESRTETRPTAKDVREVLREPTQYWPLLPGDIAEIEPPPPSTHLHTYTRTTPPTVEKFYQTMFERGLPLRDLCVAFVVQHARTFAEGRQRLWNAVEMYPAISALFAVSRPADILKVPRAIFRAAIRMFARFPHRRLRAIPPDYHGLDKHFTPKPGSRIHVNFDNTAVHAIRLLSIRPTSDTRTWTVVMNALNRHSSDLGACSKMTMDRREGLEQSSSWPGPLRACMNAMSAIELQLIVLDLQHENRVDIDEEGFVTFCRIVQRALKAWWVLLEHNSGGGSHLESMPAVGALRAEAQRMVRGEQDVCDRLVSCFEVLVGGDEVSNVDQVCEDKFDGDIQRDQIATLDPLKLLRIPPFAVLHAYVRALGWFAQYDQLLRVSRWMRTRRSELAERQRHDRRGADHARRTIVALRVFLERDWISAEAQHTGDGTIEQDITAFLSRIRTPAPQDVIDEIRQIVESVPDWHGWPDDEEVREYTTDAPFAWLSKASPGEDI